MSILSHSSIFVNTALGYPRRSIVELLNVFGYEA